MICLKIPKISIITVVLNGEKHLEKAIKSVIQQQYNHLEYIIIDGGSTDNTIRMIESYSAYITYWHSKPDRGGNDAYNLGLQHATGDIIAFLNADDWYEPEILKKVARAFLDNEQPDVISCNTRIISSLKKNKLYQGKQLDLTLKNILFGLPLLNARFFKREFLHRIGIFNSHDSHANYLISADRDFLIRVVLNHARDITTHHLGYTYLAHPESKTMSNCNITAKKVLNEHINLCQHYLNSSNLNKKQMGLFKNWLIHQSIRLAWLEFLSGHYSQAMKIAIHGWRKDKFKWLCLFLEAVISYILKSITPSPS